MSYDFRVKFGVIHEVGSTITVSPDDAIDALAETDTIQPTADAQGAVYTDYNGKIFVL